MAPATEGQGKLSRGTEWSVRPYGGAEFLHLTCPDLKWSGPFPFHGSDEQTFGADEQVLDHRRRYDEGFGP